MRHQHISALTIGIGSVAGLRPMTAYAVVALALERGWIRPSNSPLARIVSARALKRIAELAASELIADKLPFTPSRLHAAPLASRVVSGAICGRYDPQWTDTNTGDGGARWRNSRDYGSLCRLPRSKKTQSPLAWLCSRTSGRLPGPRRRLRHSCIGGNAQRGLGSGRRVSGNRIEA